MKRNSAMRGDSFADPSTAESVPTVLLPPSDRPDLPRGFPHQARESQVPGEAIKTENTASAHQTLPDLDRALALLNRLRK